MRLAAAAAVTVASSLSWCKVLRVRNTGECCCGLGSSSRFRFSDDPKPTTTPPLPPLTPARDADPERARAGLRDAEPDRLLPPAVDGCGCGGAGVWGSWRLAPVAAPAAPAVDARDGVLCNAEEVCAGEGEVPCLLGPYAKPLLSRNVPLAERVMVRALLPGRAGVADTERPLELPPPAAACG